MLNVTMIFKSNTVILSIEQNTLVVDEEEKEEKEDLEQLILCWLYSQYLV